jgi:hypothetical protein
MVPRGVYRGRVNALSRTQLIAALALPIGAGLALVFFLSRDKLRTPLLSIPDPARTLA